MNDVFVFYSHLFYCRVLLHNLIRDGKYTCSVVSAANIGELRQRVFLWLILHREGIASALYARQEVMCVCVCVCVRRMQEKEREWRASVEASIESKDARSREIQRQREANKKQVRVTPAVLSAARCTCS